MLLIGLSMRRSLVAPVSGAAQCDIAIAIYRISLSFAGSELGNDPTAWKQLRWRRRLDLICTSGQRRTNTLVARTYARWPLRASGVLGPLARTGPQSKKSRRASGPAVNVEAWTRCARYDFNFQTDWHLAISLKHCSHDWETNKTLSTWYSVKFMGIWDHWPLLTFTRPGVKIRHHLPVSIQSLVVELSC